VTIIIINKTCIFQYLTFFHYSYQMLCEKGVTTQVEKSTILATLVNGTLLRVKGGYNSCRISTILATHVNGALLRVKRGYNSCRISTILATQHVNGALLRVNRDTGHTCWLSVILTGGVSNSNSKFYLFTYLLVFGVLGFCSNG